MTRDIASPQLQKAVASFRADKKAGTDTTTDQKRVTRFQGAADAARGALNPRAQSDAAALRSLKQKGQELTDQQKSRLHDFNQRALAVKRVSQYADKSNAGKGNEGGTTFKPISWNIGQNRQEGGTSRPPIPVKFMGAQMSSSGD
jgi:hypothetical protein